MRFLKKNLTNHKVKLNIKKFADQGYLQRTAALAVMVMVTVLSVVTVMAATHTAHIVYDGKKTDVEMTDSDTADILSKAGIKVSSDDIVSRKDDPDNGGDVIITVKSAYGVGISADGKEKNVTAHYGDTVGGALKHAGVITDSNDIVTPSAVSSVNRNMTVNVKRCCDISVDTDGRTVNAVVCKESVSNALKEIGITLGSADTVNADLNSTVSEGQKLKVTRVAYKEVVSTEPVAYKTVTTKSKALSSGQVKVQTSGQNGIQTVVTKQKLVDGKLSDSTVVSKTITKQPVNKVVAVGAKSAVASVGSNGMLVDQNGTTVNYKRVLTGRCSCYCTGTTTSTGLKAAFGRVAVNPHIIPYGTKLYICSTDGKLVYGYATAADTGGAVMKGSIIADLYYSSYSQCMKIGTRTMNVYIL